MEQYIAGQKAAELKIDITQVVREYWEVVVLKGLFESPLGKYLIFKGGTALRLTHGSPRFSEDLDFSLTRDALRGRFGKLVKDIIRPYPELTLTDLEEKHYTYLAEIKVTQAYLKLPFRIKIEISKREQKGIKKELKLLYSPVTNLQIVGQVATMEQIYSDKLSCMKSRAKPKDFFDLWYLSEKLRISYEARRMSSKGKKELVRDLRKYLPRDFWPAIDSLAK